MPKNENVIMPVGRNDIWWNMKQIRANLVFAGNVASGRELGYYSDIDTTPSPLNIYEGMSPEAESAAWERYRQNLRESGNRKANYNKLQNFCDRTARDARNRLEELYDSLEELYKKHVVEFENTDDDYKGKAEEVYDACTDDKERIWDAFVKTLKFLNDIEEGAEAAVVDFISGILGLAIMLAKIDLALRVAIVTMPFGTTPQWVKDTGKEAVEGALGIVQILKNPGRALAAIGQRVTDTVEEKGVPYAVSYVVADIVIGILVDKGIGKLKALGKTDDVAKLSTKADDVGKMADNFEAGVNAVEEIDNAAGIVDDAAGMADDVAALGNIEGGLNPSLLDELANSGVKYNPDDVITVIKTSDGKLMWLEGGNSKAGLTHILERHADDFAAQGVSDIPNLLENVLSTNPIRTGSNAKGLFADYIFNGNSYRVAYGTNGFVVSFYPID